MEIFKMKSALAITLLTVLIGVQSDSNPVITIDPNIIYAGLTDTLEVKCIFPQKAKQTLGSIFSLSLLHLGISDKGRGNFLATVSEETTMGVYSALQDHYELSGQINNTGDSYVKITWKYPAKDRAGVYKCEVHVEDWPQGPAPASSNMSLNAEPSLNADPPSIDTVVLEMRNIQNSISDYLIEPFSSINHLENVLLNLIQEEAKHMNTQTQLILSFVNRLQNEVSNHTRNEISNMSDQIASISSTVNQLQSEISNQIQSEIDSIKNQKAITSTTMDQMFSLSAQLDAIYTGLRTDIDKAKVNQDRLYDKVRLARQAMFINSSSFMGRHYWLPKSPTSHYSDIDAQAACIAYGGYLAEVNSKDELEFLRNFLRRYAKRFSFVYVGGSDEGHEAMWSYVYHDFDIVRPTFQYSDELDIKDCISLNRHLDFAMSEEHCSLTSREALLGFICEVPDK